MRLVDSRLAALHSIPGDDWLSINRRVALAIKASSIAEAMSRVLPSYMRLLAAAQLWQNTTFPRLGTAAGDLAHYATQARARFSSIAQSVAELGPAPAAVPPELHDAVVAALKSLDGSTNALASRSSALLDQIAHFQMVNLAVDQEIERDQSIKTLGPGLTAALAAVARGVGLARGAWGALRDDLREVAGAGFNIDIPFLLGLDIQAALVAWAEIANQANAFTASLPRLSQGTAT